MSSRRNRKRNRLLKHYPQQSTAPQTLGTKPITKPEVKRGAISEVINEMEQRKRAPRGLLGELAAKSL
jgi:hypothetical protein